MQSLFMRSAAEISDCTRYRYTLTRTWDDALPAVCFIMLNPSTAGAVEDDNTIRRCLGFAQTLGCGSLVVVNLFAWRATDPKALFDVFYRRQYTDEFGKACYHNGDPIGPENDRHILGAVKRCRTVVAAWGIHGCMMLRDEQVKRLLRQANVEVSCLGLTKHGQPRHPLFVRADAPLIPFRWKE